MPPKHTKPSYRTANPDERIIIERRVIVGTIEPDAQGEHPMLRVAFMAAADAMAESLTHNDAFDNLTFTYGAHTFTFAAEPKAPADAVTAVEDVWNG